MLNILKGTCNHVYITIFIAVWTVVQSFVHVYGLIYIQWWRNCKIGREHQQLLLFSDDPCDNETYAHTDNITEIEWEGWIVRELDAFIFTYIILDALWIVTSVGLLTGACCLIKGIWALVFYLPWLLMSGIILIFDIFCTVFFGSNIPTYGTFLDWFNFIGLTSQINSLHALEGSPIDLVLGAVSIVMTFVSARAIIVCIINVAFLLVIFKLAMRQYKPEHQSIKRKVPPDMSPVKTNSQRIREWHDFYDTSSGLPKGTNINSDFCDNVTTKNDVGAVNLPVRKPSSREIFLTVHTYNRNCSFNLAMTEVTSEDEDNNDSGCCVPSISTIELHRDYQLIDDVNGLGKDKIKAI